MTDRWRGLALPIGAVVVALAIGGVLMAIAGAAPIEAYVKMFDGAFGGRYEIAETLVRAIPIAVIALSVVPALRAGVFTVGSEGSLAIGAVVSTAAVLAVRGAPSAVLLAVGLVAGIIGGVAWALVPALLRALLQVNEILSTLLMNYLAAALLLVSLRTWLATPEDVATPRSERLPAGALIPDLLAGTRLHWGLLAVVVAALALGWWVRSTQGFKHDVLGVRPALAERLGVREPRAVLGTMLLAGAGAGVAGWIQVAGVQGTLYPSVAGGLGFTGVLVALLGDLTPGRVAGAAVLYAALVTGAEGVQTGSGVPSSIATVLQGLLLLAAALGFASRQRRVRRQLGSDQVDDPGNRVGTTHVADAGVAPVASS